LTIPATVAAADRSFIKLKLVKNYLRSAMSPDRVVDLAKLSKVWFIVHAKTRDVL